MSRPSVIWMDGPDGVGKSSLVEALASSCPVHWQPVATLKAPYTADAHLALIRHLRSPSGPSGVISPALLSKLAEDRNILARTILKYVWDGTLVLVDRWWPSTHVYQWGPAGGSLAALPGLFSEEVRLVNAMSRGLWMSADAPMLASRVSRRNAKQTILIPDAPEERSAPIRSLFRAVAHPDGSESAAVQSAAHDIRTTVAAQTWRVSFLHTHSDGTVTVQWSVDGWREHWPTCDAVEMSANLWTYLELQP